MKTSVLRRSRGSTDRLAALERARQVSDEYLHWRMELAAAEREFDTARRCGRPPAELGNLLRRLDRLLATGSVLAAEAEQVQAPDPPAARSWAEERDRLSTLRECYRLTLAGTPGVRQPAAVRPVTRAALAPHIAGLEAEPATPPPGRPAIGVDLAGALRQVASRSSARPALTSGRPVGRMPDERAALAAASEAP